ncbi:hypothetical protein CSOJ01_09441 [Colletotrichum sojae]|uniref:Uncharacterized protein n=1 Tax=Colletotrichum sojae TaxID=2175907 RepID=A0A8H6J2Y7_9PEZI|nr:hypothetical protein CSOJ01_09441 [Colletotrichum sojae]
MDAHTLRHESKLQQQVPQDQLASKPVDRTTLRPPLQAPEDRRKSGTKSTTPQAQHLLPETARRTSRSRDGRNINHFSEADDSRLSPPAPRLGQTARNKKPLGHMVRPETVDETRSSQHPTSREEEKKSFEESSQVVYKSLPADPARRSPDRQRRSGGQTGLRHASMPPRRVRGRLAYTPPITSDSSSSSRRRPDDGAMLGEAFSRIQHPPSPGRGTLLTVGDPPCGAPPLEDPLACQRRDSAITIRAEGHGRSFESSGRRQRASERARGSTSAACPTQPAYLQQTPLSPKDQMGEKSAEVKATNLRDILSEKRNQMGKRAAARKLFCRGRDGRDRTLTTRRAVRGGGQVLWMWDGHAGRSMCLSPSPLHPPTPRPEKQWLQHLRGAVPFGLGAMS